MYMGRFGLIVSLMGAMRIFYRIKNVLKWKIKNRILSIDYPLIGAVLQKELRSVLGENVNKSISRNMKIKATKYRNDYRVWLDYAGDYRNENIE